MRHYARLCALVFVALFSAISADFNPCLAQTPTPTPTPIPTPSPTPIPTPSPIQAGQVIISELRLRGPAGAEDEFVELYNNTDVPIVVQATDQSSGWTVAISNGQITGPLFTIPNGTVIPARGHYLGANANGYSLCEYPSGYGPGGGEGTTKAAAVAAPCLTNGLGGTFPHTTPDQTWDFDVPDGTGVALFSTTSGPSMTAATQLDAVGFTSSPALYREGTGLTTVVTLNFEHSYYRDLRSGTPRDTGNNSADFLLVGTSGGAPGLQSIPLLGAPGPENRNSPVQMNSSFTAALLDPDAGVSQPPNRSRDFNSDPTNNSDFGTLLIRRTITNNTGQPVTRLRFRVVNITTLGTPNAECQGTPCADLRVRSSLDGEVSVDGQLVPVRGLRLEEPPEQAAGGGYNSSLSADFVTIFEPMGIGPGESINVEFRLGVMRTGPFRFFVNIEAQNTSEIIIRDAIPDGDGADVGVGSKQRRVMMETRQAAPNANTPAPSPAAAPRRTIYVPLFINTRPPASNSTRPAEKKADDESKEPESDEASPSARPAPETPAASTPDSPAAAAGEPTPATTRRAASKKRPAGRGGKK